MNGNRDIKPMSWARKSEIAERADSLEARAEAKKEAEAQAEHLHIVIDYGVKENGKKDPPRQKKKPSLQAGQSKERSIEYAD